MIHDDCLVVCVVVQVAASADCRRLICVSMNRGHTFSGMAEVGA